MTYPSLVSSMAYQIGEKSAYNVSKKEDGSTVVEYDNPNCIDEETTYVFYKDGSASSVSHAWGTKTYLPAETFKNEDMNKSAKEIVDLYRSYQSEYKKLDYQA